MLTIFRAHFNSPLIQAKRCQWGGYRWPAVAPYDLQLQLLLRCESTHDRDVGRYLIFFGDRPFLTTAHL